MLGGHILYEKQRKHNIPQLIKWHSLHGAATTLIDTFVEHIAIECTEHENPSLSYLETKHQAI